MKRLLMTQRLLLASLLSLSVIFFNSCDDDAPEAENESETITTVRVTLTPQGGGAASTFEAKDADGDGPGNIVIAPITLDANTAYDVSVMFLNELDPADVEDITEEIEEEDDEHQLFFVANPATLLSVAYADQDGNGLPVGLSTTWTTGDAGAGTVTVTLKHQPDAKSATSTINTGETDIAVPFPVTVQ